MVTIGILLPLLSVIFMIGSWKKYRIVTTKWFLWLIVLSGPLSVIAIEAGWWLTEVGRQPWILRGIMRTNDAATTSGQVDTMLLLFSGLYLMLGIGSVVVLSRMFRKNSVEQELTDRASEKAGAVE
jgi:cytochrome d ubiquinol oxidase subunit I